jgi:hypothetical protein
VSDNGLTDRDRLAMAFEDLREAGYAADITLGYSACCRECALKQIAEEVHEDDEGNITGIALPDKFIFWFVSKDDYSFVGSADGFPIPERYLEMDEEAIAAISEEFDAAITSERLSKYTTLLNPLNLQWGGNADEIVGVLRKHGLKAACPNSDHWCIEVTAA